MEAITLIYLAYCAIALAVFAVARPAAAVAIVYLGGLVFLPVAYYAPIDPVVESPYWILTIGLPSDQLINKAWLSALVAVAGALVFDRINMTKSRPSRIDFPIACLCLWPLAQSLFVVANPAGWLASLYFIGVWGLPWLLGRIYFRDRAGRLALVDGLIAISLALIPVAIIEGFSGIRLYETLFGPHPFAGVGAERYLGYRPLAFFEDGNQYGLWMACAAIAALWRARQSCDDALRRPRFAVAILLFATVLFSQSFGASLLMIVGGAIVLLPALLLGIRRFFLPGLVIMSLGGAIFVSGVVPIRALAKETEIGNQLLGALRATGRGSFSWRISQEEKSLPLIRENLILGSGQWDWWRELETRPWGFPLLMIGQFGLIGFLLALSAMLAGIIRQTISGKYLDSLSAKSSGMPLFILLLVSMIDALLNSFLLLPAIAIAGGIAATRPSAHRRSANESA